MDEFEIIRRYFTPERHSDSVIVGVGDDGAVLRPDPRRDLVTVVDTLVEGVHFPPSLGVRDIAYRAIAANVSDIAAMGARPRWMTMGLTMHDADPGWLEAFSRGVALAQETLDVELVGGDITHGDEIVISVQVIGDVEKGRAITRSGAGPEDGIYISGTPGDAAAGLSLLHSMEPGIEPQEWMNYLSGRFSRPEPRVALGQSIAAHASAAIDVSDGLYSDIAKLLAASGVAGVIEIENLPLSKELRTNMSLSDARRFALGGGEDFELCFTTPEDLGGSTEIVGVPVTRIGMVTAGEGLSCTLGGDAYDYRDDGYRHFR